jgi:hypothetical protein
MPGASRHFFGFLSGLADALVLFTDPRGRAASELRLPASRMSVRCQVSPPPK